MRNEALDRVLKVLDDISREDLISLGVHYRVSSQFICDVREIVRQHGELGQAYELAAKALIVMTHEEGYV